MIEKIKSLKRDLTINLYNRYAREIYALDSINLIIGDNGRGKTTLIKSIIRDLTRSTSPLEFIADGVSENLGIIYYTATPFHQAIKRPQTAVAFIDASSTEHSKQSFVESSLEYMAISKLLGLESSLRSVHKIDLLEMAFELAKQNFSVVQKSGINGLSLSEDLIESYRAYKNYNNLYAKIHRNTFVLTGELSNASNADGDDFLINRIYELENLNFELEEVAKKVIVAKENVAKIFLCEYFSNDDHVIADWIVASILLKESSSSTDRKQIAYGLQNKDLGLVDKSTRIGARILPLRQHVLDFISILNYSESGAIKLRKNNIEILVNTPRLLRSDANKRIIDAAHKNGLIKIGFDSMSSGQAAIMHQMINISQSIQELVNKNKREILVFIDEGDLLLHLSWQREYISLLDKRLGILKKKNKIESLQVVIASHSPLLASDILRDSITRLDNGTKLPSFGAPIQQIINYSFGTPSIGIVAQNTIKKLKEKNWYSGNDVDLINQIDDEFIRQLLLKKAS